MSAYGYMTKGTEVLKVKRVKGPTRWCPFCDYSYHMVRELVPITACPNCQAVWSEHPSYVPPVVEPQAETATTATMVTKRRTKK